MEGRVGGGENSWTGFCTVVALDPTRIWYNACATCERPLPEYDANSGNAGISCRFCNRSAFNPGFSGCRRLYRVLLSVATEDRVKVVVCFDRAARVLFGCSADEFFKFCRVNTSAAETACRILEGEIFRMTLNAPKNGNAEHLRVASIVPARSNFCPAINTMKKIHGVKPPFLAHGAECSSKHMDPGLCLPLDR